MNDKSERQAVSLDLVNASELSLDQLEVAAGGMINVRGTIAASVKGGALDAPRSGGDDDLDDLEMER